MSRPALLPTLALVTAFGGSAFAQTPPTAEQAHSIETQISAWLNQVTAGSVPLSARPVQVTPEGDHFLARVPLAQFGKVQPATAAVTTKLRALDGTRWLLDDQQIPPDLTFTTTEQVPDAPDAKDPSPDGKHTETVTFHVVVGQQDVHGTFDPTYTTATTSGGTIASMDISKTGGVGPSTTHIGRFTSQASTQPVDPAHVDILLDGSAVDYSIKADMPDGGSLTLQAARLHVMNSVSGLAHNQIIPVIQTLINLGQMAKAAATDDSSDGPTPEQKVVLNSLLTKSHALLTGSKLEESLEGVKFDVSGTGGSLDKVDVTFGGDAPQDMLTADMGFTMDGLKVDGLPPNLAGYLPTHFAIHPTVSNISVAALTKMGMDATAPLPAGQPAPDPDFQALFAHGGINVGFDKFELAVVGTTLSGTGKFVASGPQTVTGQAEFTAKGLDALVAKMQADPMLAAGVPVVIFLKGIARTTGDQSVWQVSVDNAKVLVNGVDLSAMAGGFNK